MRNTLWVVFVSLVVVFQFGAVTAEEDEEEEEERVTTECEKDIAKEMCDNCRQKMSDCADLMPEEEHPIFHECAEKLGLTNEKEWLPILDAVCGQEEIVKVALDLIDCYDKTMQEAVYEMKNQYVYPEEHFECKDSIFRETIEKMSCPCQLEKTNKCSNV